MTVVEKRSYSRKAGRTSCEAETCTSGSASRSADAMRRSWLGSRKAKSRQTAMDSASRAAQLLDQPPISSSVSSSITPAGPIRSRGLEAEVGVDQGPGPGPARVVEAGAGLAADVEQVGESPRRDQCGARAALLEQGVGPDGHPVGERLDVAGPGAGALQDLVDRGDHAARLILGRARDLRRVQAVAVEQRGVGEGPTDVDAEQHRSTLSTGRLRHQSRPRAAC